MTAAKAASAPAEASVGSMLAGKHMTFRLASEDYGVPILKVRELIGLQEITRVPGAPSFVRGVINLRGRVVPVVDLRAKLGLPEIAPGRYAVIVVVQIDRPEGPLRIGMLVDEVLEVRDIAASQVEPTPSFGFSDSAVDFILGIGKVEKRVVFLLDIDRVLNSAEIQRLPFGSQPQKP